MSDWLDEARRISKAGAEDTLHHTPAVKGCGVFL